MRTDLLQPSEHRSGCAYKGFAGYWSVRIGDTVYDNLAWIYRTPLPECQKIAGLVCFYNEKVDPFVDGQRLERPRTPFS